MGDGIGDGMQFVLHKACLVCASLVMSFCMKLESTVQADTILGRHI